MLSPGSVKDVPSGNRHQLLIVGGGLTGLSAALAAGKIGLNVGLIRPKASKDPRTTALMDGAVKMMQALEVWSDFAPDASPLKSLKIVDMTGRLFRAPTACFKAAEIDLEAFAWNVPNERLLGGLEKAVAREKSIKIYTSTAREIEVDQAGVTIALDRKRLTRGQLLLGADGRNSHVRRSHGIALKETRYPQVALAFHIAHETSHQNCSVEFHTRPGPCTFVPMPGNHSAVVWVMTPEESEARAALSPQGLIEALDQITRGYLGGSKLISPLGRFPLSNAHADPIIAARTVLVGEAAHLLPPIGAQGLNLGLRDVAVLIELLATSKETDLGSDALTQAYEKKRRLDLTTRRLAADFLNRSLISNFLPAQLSRAFGMNVLNHFGPLRRLVMREGLAPQRESTALFRGELPHKI